MRTGFCSAAIIAGLSQLAAPFTLAANFRRHGEVNSSPI
jgi:hypothetical protein